MKAFPILLVFLLKFHKAFGGGTTFPGVPNRNKGVITTDNAECSNMAKDIFAKGGGVADAAVTLVLCENVASPYSVGLGGGLFATIYLREEQEVHTLNAREVAPKLATRDMYKNDTKLSETGGLAVAVPGELKGLWELHKSFGKLEWKDLLQPVIELCKSGSLVTSYSESVFSSYEEQIKAESTLSEMFINQEAGSTYKQGDRIKRLKLAETLEVLAEQGAGALYGGEIGKKLAENIKARGGIISEEDFSDYKVRWSSPISSSITDGLTFHSMPLPSSSAIIHLMLNIIGGYDELKLDSLTYHRIVESMKFAFAKRTYLGDVQTPEVLDMMNKLTDKSYADSIRSLISDTQTNSNVSYYKPKVVLPEDDGTVHMNIIAPNGDAISMTGTINSKFGAFFASEQTGIILNNEMNDFAQPGEANLLGFPPNPANMIRPGKYPLSSMSPSIVTDKNGDVRLILGATGGGKILTGIFNVLFQHLYMKKPIADAIEARRLHHPLMPPELHHETDFDAEILKNLSEKFGHILIEDKPDGGFATTSGISLIGGEVQGTNDARRGGSTEIF